MRKMMQEIQIAVSNENIPIGTFKISTMIKDEKIKKIIPKQNKVLKEVYFDKNSNKAEIKLINVNIVDEIDGTTPIEYCKKNKNVNIFLLEEQEYDIHFEPVNDGVDVFEELLSHNNHEFFKDSTKYDGFLRAKSYVGKTFLDIPHYNFKLPIEIKSRKINYESDYRNMIGDLALFSSGLLSNINAPLYQSYSKSIQSKETYYETFLLIEYIFKEKNLPSVLEYLSRNLYSSLERYTERIPTSFAKDIGGHELIDIISNPQNLVSTDIHSIINVNGKGYAPLRMNEIKYEETIDVPENRFYKYFLEYIDDVIKKLMKIVEEDKKTDSYIYEELVNYKTQINYHLSQKIFKDISKMEYAPLNSQVLQKKEGYREILGYYLLFDYGLNISWNELTDEFKTYQKKLSTLYEYWIYFKLAEYLKKYTRSNIKEESIINKEDSKWSFNLKKGKTSYLIFDTVTVSNQEVGIKLFYNKTFNEAKRKKEEDDDFIITHGKKSYSVELEPDYTLEITIENTKYYLHFDAKYKLNLFDESFKNQDIVKMHSYKDGINKSYGSFVLYPGNYDPIIFSDTTKYDYFGVGAIPLNPSNNNESGGKIIYLIKNYISNLIEFHEEKKKEKNKKFINYKV